MTREEAIKLVKEVTGMSLDWDDAHYEALQIAIGALEAKPCEDAISRKWTLDVVNNFVFDTETDRNRIIHIVRDTAPSVTPKQKTGEWIDIKDQKPEEFEDVLVKDIDGDVTCAYLCDDVTFLERFSGEIIDDVVEWMEIPG